LSFPGERRRGAADDLQVKDVQMGEFNKDQGQADQTGQTDTSAFGQFDKGQNRQDRSERGQQDRVDFADAEADTESSSARDSEIGSQAGQKQTGQDRAGQQGGFGAESGQQEQNQDQDGARQGGQYQDEKGQSGDQNR
jgi:hypothetical protein